MNTQALLRLPYRAARTPLGVLNHTLVKRLPADSRRRLAFERIIGSFDEMAGRVLGDRRVEKHGTVMRERADTMSEAVRLEQNAAQRRSAADDSVQRAERQAGELREEAQRRQREGVQAAVEKERKEKQAASRRARAQAAATKRQADARAASRLEAVDQQRKQTEAKAVARKTQATAQAKSELADVAAKKATARRRRAQADQLGKLSAAKQQARRS